MGFEQPGFLLALVLVPLARGALLRVVVLLLVLAAAEPTLPLEPARTAVLIDQSPSAPETAGHLAAKLNIPATVYWGFAERAEKLPGPLSRRNDLGKRTLLQRALYTAAREGADRIVLISDGLWRETAYSPLPVFALQVAPKPRARIDRLIAPPAPRRGEVVEVRAVLESTEPVHARLTFQTAVEERRLDIALPAGTSSQPFRFELKRHTTVRVSLDSPIGKDGASVTLDPLGPGRALVVDDPATAAYLRATGWEVHESGPEGLADTPELLVIGGPVTTWSPLDLARLEKFLREGGAVLWTATPTGLFYGNWQHSTLADELPLEPEPGEKAALILVLDVSGSMNYGSPSKLSRAIEGATRLVRAAGPEDTLGIIAFTSQYRWLLPPKPMTQRARREAETHLARLEAGGGTRLAPAYAAAAAAIEPLTAKKRWILVLSDGQLEDDPEATLNRAREAKARGVKTLTLALGNDAGRTFLDLLAKAGGGRFYDLADSAALPGLLALLGEEAFRSQRVEGSFQPLLGDHPVTRGLTALPPARVLLPARAKPWAQVPVSTATGKPLLALGQLSGGRVAALTTDLGRSWREAPQATLLLQQLARWLIQTPARPRYDWEITPAATVLRVYGRFDPLPLAQWEGRVEPLEPTAPFAFRLRLPARFTGTVRVTSGGRTVFRASAPAPAEWPATNGRARLRELAAASGGALLDDVSKLPPPRRKPVSLSPYLLALALGLFMLERWRERAVV